MVPTRREFITTAMATGASAYAQAATDGNSPRKTRPHQESVSRGVKIDWVKKIYSDEQWNGWPDLAYWKDVYYICFANGASHGSRDHRIMLTTSRDLERWSPPREVLGPPGNHLESFFLATPENLFIHASCQDGKRTYTNSIRSMDGQTWEGRKQAHDDGFIFWGQSEYRGKFYVAAHVDAKSTDYLLASAEGETWEQISLISDNDVTETALCFLDSGELMSISRRAPRDFALLCLAKPPYTRWHSLKTNAVVEGPALKKIADRIIVSGRCSELVAHESIARWYQESRRTGVFFYEDGKLERQCLLPSGGDTGYPGILPMGKNNALIVYYSEHQTNDHPTPRYKHCGSIYLASVTVT